MRINTTAQVDQAALLGLPWDVPLEEWPADLLVDIPRGISRHVVRFVQVGQAIYAFKELLDHVAEREYRTLRRLEGKALPTVKVAGCVTERTDAAGEPLDGMLMTVHLEYSLPYRAIFSRTLRPETAEKLLDALAQLLVQLHLAGFFWGDVSLSNTLFRRDAGSFAAWLVDAETGELREQLSAGQRAHDLELAEVNLGGELLDLQMAGLLDPALDPGDTAADIIRRYTALWDELTRDEVFEPSERWRVNQRIQRLHELGFDVSEMQVVSEADGRRLRLQTVVVEPGHHSRRLFALTGLDVQENQARRLLADMRLYRAETRRPGVRRPEQAVAHAWLSQVFEPAVAAVPADLRGKLEPAELYHELLEHRWFLSEYANRDVGLEEALTSYVEHVLRAKPDERTVFPTHLVPTVEYTPDWDDDEDVDAPLWPDSAI